MEEKTEKKKRSWGVKLLYWVFVSVVGVLGMLLLAAVAFWHWVNEWQKVEPPAFYPSWTESQRADLREVDQFYTSNVLSAAILHMLQSNQQEELEKWMRNRVTAPVAALINRRNVFKPLREALHETMATGKGDICTPDGTPVAAYALRLHKIDLLREMVKRGCHPGKTYIPWYAPCFGDEPMKSNLLVDALVHHDLLLEHTLPVDEHIALLEFLCVHGADVSHVPDARLARLNASLCLIAEPSDKGAVLAWLLRKGLPMSEEGKRDTVGFLLHKDRGRDICEALQAEGLLPPPGNKPHASQGLKKRPR